MRMFAGPNGSGKTTIKQRMDAAWIGIYVNPDDIEATLRRTGQLNLNQYVIQASDTEVREFLTTSEFLRSVNLADACSVVTCHANVVNFGGVAVNSYHASVLSDFLRRKLILAGISFSFETVMSAEDKVELLREAQCAGFRTYLYYVSTENPLINVARVKLRVSQGGHSVPEMKVVERYHRSLALLREAIRHTNRAYFFDTSTEDAEEYYFAEVTDGTTLTMHSDTMPNWFKDAVYDKF